MRLTTYLWAALSATMALTTFNLFQIAELKEDAEMRHADHLNLSKRIEAMNKKIQLERQDSYSSFEDLRERFAEKNFEVAKLTTKLERKKK